MIEAWTEQGMRTGIEANKVTQDGNRDGDGDGTGTGMGTEVETHGRTRDGNGDGNGYGNKRSSELENGDGNEDGIGEGGREAKKRKKPHKSCRRNVGNEEDLGGKREKFRQDQVGSVAADPDDLKNRREAGGGAQGTQGLYKDCTSRESVSHLCVLSEVFVISIIDPLGGPKQVAYND